MNRERFIPLVRGCKHRILRLALLPLAVLCVVAFSGRGALAAECSVSRSTGEVARVILTEGGELLQFVVFTPEEYPVNARWESDPGVILDIEIVPCGDAHPGWIWEYFTLYAPEDADTDDSEGVLIMESGHYFWQSNGGLYWDAIDDGFYDPTLRLCVLVEDEEPPPPPPSGNQPPYAWFDYMELPEYGPSGLVYDGMNLVGKKVLLDAGSSYDPDGSIVEAYFRVSGPHSASWTTWPSGNIATDPPVPIFFPREDYEVTLFVGDDGGLWSSVTRQIAIHLPVDLVRVVPIEWRHFGRFIPEWLTIFYKYDGEYYAYPTTGYDVGFPNAPESIFVVLSRHEIGRWYTVAPPPAGLPIVGYLRYSDRSPRTRYYRRIEDAWGVGLSIAKILGWPQAKPRGPR